MPGRNIYKVQVDDGFYHVYNRGVNKRIIFSDKEDYSVFLNLLKRYLGKQVVKDPRGRLYPNYHGVVELLAFCLMPNHFHAFVYQKDAGAFSKLFQSVTTTYSVYYNKKHKRTGPLFQSRFRASHITTDDYFMHISRYIHLNPKEYRTWEYSSLPYYLGQLEADWVRPDKVMGMFKDAKDYARFCADYEGHKAMLDELKYELANTRRLDFDFPRSYPGK